MLDLKMLKDMPESIVFAQGVVENSQSGVYMTSDFIGRKMKWVAKRGQIHDWAIYIHWEDSGDFNWIKENGDKLRFESDIKKLVPCDEEAFKMYRF